MDPILLGGILGGVEGLGSSNTEKAANDANLAKSVSAIRYAPWTGVNISDELGKNFRSRDTLGAMLQGAGTGIKTGEMIKNLMADSTFRKKLSNRLNNKELTPEVVEMEEGTTPLPQYTPYSMLSGSADQDTINSIRDRLTGMKGFNNAPEKDYESMQSIKDRTSGWKGFGNL